MSTATPTAEHTAPRSAAAEPGVESLALAARPAILIDRVRHDDLAAFKDIEQLQKKVRGCDDLEIIPSFTLQNLAEGCGQVMIARDRGKAVGYAYSFLRQDPLTREISFYSVPVGVDPEYRGKGISHALIDALHQDAVHRGIERSDWRPDEVVRASDDGTKLLGHAAETAVSVWSVDHRDIAALKDIEALQRKIWGYNDLDIIPAATLRDLASGCGQLLIARVGDTPVGFAFTFLKKDPATGKECFYLDLVGVDADYQDRGIGMQLMQLLRADALSRGVSTLEWRYDGLETRNARLYLGKLGAQVVAFKENSYGVHDDIQSDGLPTDRFVVRWELNKANRIPEFPLTAPAAIVVGENGVPEINQSALTSGGAHISMPVPLHFQAVKDSSREVGNQWIKATRAASNALFNAGYEIVAFRRGESAHGEYLWANSNVTA